jgi:hypothetical protein
MSSSSADKARAAASNVLEYPNKEVDPSCTECTDTPPIRAIILYPNLGTPLIIPPGETKLNFFIAAESRSRTLFGAGESQQFPVPAPLGYMYVDKHLRIYPIKEKKLKDDTKVGRLWNDGKLCATAFKHVRVWCIGRLNSGVIKDVSGKVVANIRPKTIEGYNSIEAAWPSDKEKISANEPMEWLYQIQISIEHLPNKLDQGSLITLAWMMMLPDSYKAQKDLAGLYDWEYQDKIIYDFLELQKKNKTKSHIPDLYEFDVSTATASKLPSIKRIVPKRLKSWHPVMVGKSESLKIGHLSDVHINCRQFALASSNASVIEGISGKAGAKVNNCFISLRELFEGMKKAGADVIFITGDLLDFNRNLDPRKQTSSDPSQQWPIYDLDKKLNDKDLYPRGIDDMLVFSLLRYSYEKLDLPVFLTTGNHEAYDVPYGMSPRANPFIVKKIVEQANSDQKAIIPARLRASIQTAITTSKRLSNASAGIKSIPFFGPQWDVATEGLDKWGRKAIDKLRVHLDPNSFELFDRKMNEGIPADHNLTIYEACLIYGPSFPQVVRPFNFVPENFDWFFTLFTPLANYFIEYKNQVLVGLDWGESEIMVNIDMSAGELRETPWNSAGIAGALSGLPRADKSLDENQKTIIEQARCSKKKFILFSHFTLINYDLPFPLSYEPTPFSASDKVFNDVTKGTFSCGREWLYPRLNNGIHFVLSGHSHRSAVYRVKQSADGALSTVGYQPAEHHKSEVHSNRMHAKLFNDSSASRVAVSSCGGPIGVQNFKGELFGWNLMPPSGTLIDIDAQGPNELRRIVAAKYRSARPRFCVALDYVQVHSKKQVIAWIPKSDPGWYLIVVGNILEAKPFLKRMCLHAWNASFKRFSTYELNITPVEGHQCLYNCYISDHEELFRKILSKWDGGQSGQVFAQIDFNEELASLPIYSHYNFNDPWIFRVDVERNPGTQPFIVPARDSRCEIPEWDWLATVDPNRYPKPREKRSRS